MGRRTGGLRLAHAAARGATIGNRRAPCRGRRGRAGQGDLDASTRRAAAAAGRRGPSQGPQHRPAGARDRTGRDGGRRAPDADRPAPSPAAASPLEIGRELFARQWTPNDPRSHGGDGLGPVYNATSCLACHFLGGSGGAGPADVNVTLIVPGPKGFISSDSRRQPAEFNEIAINRPVNGPAEWERLLPGLREAPGVVLHHFGVDPSYGALRSALLELANDPIWKDIYELPEAAEEKLARRNTPPLFGAGLIDSVPDAVLLHLAKRRHPSTIRGRVRHLKDGRIGRFGWKAQAATLDEFVRGACANELGLEVPGNHQAASPFGRAADPRGPDLTRSECDALVAYIRSLPAPAARARPVRRSAPRSRRVARRSRLSAAPSVTSPTSGRSAGSTATSCCTTWGRRWPPRGKATAASRDNAKSTLRRPMPASGGRRRCGAWPTRPRTSTTDERRPSRRRSPRTRATPRWP